MKMWIKEWYETIKLMATDRETYKVLCREGFDEDDFVEVDRP